MGKGENTLAKKEVSLVVERKVKLALIIFVMLLMIMPGSAGIYPSV